GVVEHTFEQSASGNPMPAGDPAAPVAPSARPGLLDRLTGCARGRAGSATVVPAPPGPGRAFVDPSARRPAGTGPRDGPAAAPASASSAARAAARDRWWPPPPRGRTPGCGVVTGVLPGPADNARDATDGRRRGSAVAPADARG